MNRFITSVFLSILLTSCVNKQEKESPIIATVQVGNTLLALSEEVVGLKVPWDLQYDRINDVIIFSEISGNIKRFDIKNKTITLVDSLADVYYERTLGLLGMALYQPKNQQAFLYISYTSKKDSIIYSNLARYNYSQVGKLTQPDILLQIKGNTGHNGSRISVMDDKIYWATGDAAIDTYAQDSTILNGKILRLNLDGSIPEDNPISGSYVYAWGFRNMQGMTHNNKGQIYTSEHGDAIEDEVNLILPKKNYGWPKIEGMINTEEEQHFHNQKSTQEPLRSWTPTIAPSGMTYYYPNIIPEWNNSLLLTTLKDQSLRVLKLSDDGLKITGEDILFSDQLGRLRSVIVLPNGDVYFCSSNRDWNPQKGFPKPKDDIIYRLRKTKEQKGDLIKPQNTAKDSSIIKSGKHSYQAYCVSCHKDDGKGLQHTFPPLAQSELVNGNEGYLLKILLHGRQQTTIAGVKYEGAMPAFHFLADEEIISIANYIRTNFGNRAQKINQQNLTSLR